MLEALPELASIYLKIGACFGFGIGAACQIFTPETKWTSADILINTFLWPFVLVSALKRTL